MTHRTYFPPFTVSYHRDKGDTIVGFKATDTYGTPFTAGYLTGRIVVPVDPLFHSHKPLAISDVCQFWLKNFDITPPLVHQPQNDFPANIADTATEGPIIPLPRYTDLMIDIEAFADTPDSAPAEIGLIFFDRDDKSREFLSFRYQPSPITAIQLGFNVTPGTLKWWDDKGMTIDMYAGEPFPDVLDEITRDIEMHGRKDLRVWSRGNSYDLSILKLGYSRTSKELPWNFTLERDVRTWLEGCQFKSPRKNDHDALDDARNQALDIVEATIAIPEPARVKAVTDSDWVDFPLVREFYRDGTSNIIGQLRLRKDLQHSIAATALKLNKSPRLELMVITHDDGKPPEIRCCAMGWTPDQPVPHCDPAFREVYAALNRFLTAFTPTPTAGIIDPAERKAAEMAGFTERGEARNCAHQVLNKFRAAYENPCQPLQPLA